MLKRLILLFLCVCITGILSAQNLPDFSSIDINSLNDDQIELLIQQASSYGYSEDEILQLARAQGVTVEQLSLLDSKIKKWKTSRIAEVSDSPVGDSRLRKPYQDSLSSLREVSSDIFGLDVFRSGSFLTFQSNLNIPTPEDYVLGPGDEVFIDISGESESYYQAEINPDGNVLLENIGPIAVSGLSVKEAKNKLSSRLRSIYSGLSSNPQNTFLSVSLGQIRSIKINIVGQVNLPGTYSMSSLSTVFNALYISGGVSENGSLREVKLFRNSKLIETVDVYDFLINGNSKSNIRLENDDVILVGPYTNRITLNGAVKVSGRFELKEDETFKDLLEFSGGFSENAYQEKVKVDRILKGEKVVADIASDQFEIFTPRAGDVYEVSEVLNRYANRVIVKGAVFRPGDYALDQNTTVGSLISKSAGLRPDAYLKRAFITRTNTDFSTKTISFDLNGVIQGAVEDIKLEREDVLNILSKDDLEDETYVEISGEVGNPGVYAYSQGLTLQDIILISGGFSEAATGKQIEVTRRVVDESENDFTLADIIIKNASKDYLEEADNDPILLEPFDHIFVRKNPNFNRQQYVSIEGQVLYPGQYAIKDHGERVSDLLKRAGGLNPYAFPEGATLIRRTEFYDEQTDIEEQVDELVALRSRVETAPETLTETERFLLDRIEKDISRLEAQNQSNQALSSFAKRERLKDILESNNLVNNIQFKQAEAIGIELREILSNPGSAADLLIEEGDALIIPKKAETLRLRGKLLYPTTVRYEEGKSLKSYINAAGGFDNRAKKNGTYIVYANGSVARTKRFLFFKFYPKAEAGAEVIVPSKPLKVPVRIQDVVAITSGIATLALVISQISNNGN